MKEGVKKIYNIGLSCPFWDTLADIYIRKYSNNPLELADVLFLLPNRRACQSLINAFVRKQGLKPAILPQIVPILELDEDSLFFSGLDLENLSLEEKTAIPTNERLFLFTKLILSKPNDFGLKQISTAQALNLAIDLASLIDTVHNQGLSFDRLQDIVPEKYATHWQETLKLLKIITEFWPHILSERGMIDVSEKRNLLLKQQAFLWEKTNTQKNIVAAGITVNFPAIITLFKSISSLPNGEIYFPGINYFADEDYWEAIDETHPQIELKTLLNELNLKREDVINITPMLKPNREKLISEIMRPAVVSHEWRKSNTSLDIKDAIQGLSFINCKTQRDEALVIALKLREALTEDGKTAALITYDRNLARRVSSELLRFNIKIDDSAGIPLHLSSVGIFFNLIIDAAVDLDSEIKLINLLKNPFTLYHSSPANFRKKVYNFELNLRKKKLNDEDIIFKDSVQEELKKLSNLLQQDKVDFCEIIKEHIRVAEVLATSDEKDGSNYIWKGDTGKTAAKFITKLLESANTLGEVSARDYPTLFNLLMSGETVRSSYGTHPRLSILGPIEARLCKFDYIVLGEVNEGIWPKSADADMWMSRPMRKDFGLSLPEKDIGILGADLCGFLGADNVVITRAERVDGVPMKKSRWLLRLETVFKAFGVDIKDIEQNDLSLLAEQVDCPLTYNRIFPPAPCPPIAARPRKLSQSGIDLLVKDPYSVFAKYILQLYPLDDLDLLPDQRDYGSLIHAIIEEFNNTYPSNLPQNAKDILLSIGKRHFKDLNLSKDIETFWWIKFEKTADWIIEQEKDYRLDVKKVNNEVEGSVCYNLPNGPFTFTAKADRIDELKDGSLNIVDYKTGNIPTEKQVLSGHALQLPIEGLIAQHNGYLSFKQNTVNKLIYWRLGCNKLSLDANKDDLLKKTEEYLLKLINSFDFETTPYHSRPIPKFVPKNTDYEHLARIREWSVPGDGEADE